ncbi:MAG TPA: FAD-dependent monooxygenase, partial [Gammaproteobacteria bacterium]|nr:FAD-dependent monooxygenase [Gammaproteobacteria bacterium]
RSCLMDVLDTLPGLELTLGAGVEAVRADVGRVEVGVDTGATFDADVLIAADGTASTVRSLMGLPALRFAYGQKAVVAHVATERPHAETAWQRFLATGPVALLPLADGRCSVVWSTSAEQAAVLCEGGADEFCAALTAATDGALGAITAASERACFPLQVLHARSYCRARVALIGDAAHTIHPLAGQGMNLGLLDAAVIAEVLRAAAACGEDPGDLRVLRRYERRQKGRNVKTLLAMDLLHRLFVGAGPLLAPLRMTGMSLVDAAGPAKRRLMREALGLVGELPAAARSRAA